MREEKIIRTKKYMPAIFILYLLALLLLQNLFKFNNNMLIMLGVGAYYISLYLLDKRFLLRFFYIIFYITTNIAGVYIIETQKLYLNELGYNSYPNNSLLLIVLAHIIFIETMRLCKFSDNNFKIINDISYTIKDKYKIEIMSIMKFSMYILFILTVILFMRVVNKPFFLVKVDRFIYKELYLGPLCDILTNLYLYVAPIISIYYCRTHDKKVFYLVGTIFLYLFWIGHKFSYFFDLGYMFTLPMIVTLPYERLNKILTSLIKGIAVALIIVLFQSFVIWGRDFNQSIQYLNARLAQQGQMWWAVYGHPKSKENNLDELKDETKTYFKNNVSEDELYNSGIYKMMKLTTDEEIFKTKIYVKKSRYAYSTQASVYYYGKTVGLIIFSIISAVGYAMVNKNLINSMLSLNLIKSVLWARLSIISARVLMQSDFNKLLSIQVLLIIVILALIEINEKYKIINIGKVER